MSGSPYREPVKRPYVPARVFGRVAVAGFVIVACVVLVAWGVCGMRVIQGMFGR